MTASRLLIAGTQNRSPWQRSHSHPANLQAQKPRPLPTVSNVTKDKLKKFQYKPRDGDGDAYRQEEVATAFERTPKRPTTAAMSTVEAAEKLATPVARLDWTDLLEQGAAPAEIETEPSPNDKIFWSKEQDVRHPIGLSPMMHRRGRKRARSSSPTSSPAAEKTPAPAVNVEKLTKALRSPHADPTLELWDRYSFNGPESSTTPAGAVNPALAQLMISSSPKPLRDLSGQRSEASLRRAISCGLNWPKRRKVERTKSGSQGSSQQREMEAASKSSLVTALLDTVTSSIHDGSGVSGQRRHAESPSPKKRMQPPTRSSRKSDSTTPRQSPTSDYDDDDFDDDAFMELEASMHAETAPKAPRASSETTVKQHQKVSEPIKCETIIETDEFEDLDDDIFNTAELLAVEQTQTQIQKPRQHVSEIKRQSPEDEFGGDFDVDIDFDAVELAATQSVRRRQNESEPVCQSVVALSQCYIY